MFAQSVYLMFSSVYVCKETVEHLLLSAGGAEGHHHHHGDEEGFGQGYVYKFYLSAWRGLTVACQDRIPAVLDVLDSVITIRHGSLVRQPFKAPQQYVPPRFHFLDVEPPSLAVTGNRIPSPGTLIRSLSASKRTQHQFYDPPPTTPLAVILSNPYIASPLFFCTAILTVALLVPSSVLFLPYRALELR